MSLETQIIFALSLTLLILIFVMWKGRNERLKNALDPLQTQITELKNLVRSLPQDNQIDASQAEVVRQQINFLANAARQVDELQTEIIRLEGRRLIAFSNSPPEISADNSYWRDLSFWMRAKKQWTCEKCCINLEDRPSDLHVHHICGKAYNSPQHLKVLCIACHAEEPGHEFMKARREYKRFLRWKRSLL